jgi:hypothetical protein
VRCLAAHATRDRWRHLCRVALVAEAHLDWDKGGSARLVVVVGEAVTLSSTIPSPPGSRIEGTLRASGQRVRFKIHSARRQDDGTFALDGRMIDVTRPLRDLIAELASTD